MNDKIRIGIAGYGNLGRGVEASIAQNPDMKLVGIYTRRNPADIKPSTAGVPVHALADVANFKKDVDVMILCGGSKSDLPEQGPALATLFNTVDSFDTHAKIPEYFDAVDKAAKSGGNTALIAIGWDPGLFSVNRLYGEAVLPEGDTYSFWGYGVSQGHSDALRRVPGVENAVQYTVPLEKAMELARSGSRPTLSTREKHTRDCYVVLAEGADAVAVKEAIVTMPDYFSDYDTTVNFIGEDELKNKHAAMPHGGFVIRSGITGRNTAQTMEFRLKLDSNPEFTASALIAYARATYRLNRKGDIGAKSAFDIAPGLLSPKSAADLRKELL
ncbi:MAG: diaminopimelate dehydrogenase [Burkholderiaceae bacterium]|nr:diaminopimelate dehydrogenase [Burkholderiaceae bacterium]